ncbi:hypothetical protein ACOTVL_04075 [Aliarcobacter butzleri]
MAYTVLLTLDLNNVTQEKRETFYQLLEKNQWKKIGKINTVWKAKFKEDVTREGALNSSKNEIKRLASQSLISSFDAVLQAGEGDVVVFKS